MSAGRAAASDLAVRGGKSGLHGNTVPDNVRRGQPQGQRHRKQTAPGCVPGVRVKGCGKSAPRTRQRGRHGKPHREQNRIGTTGALSRASQAGFQAGRPGWLLETVGDDRPRGMAATSGISRPGPYKTRLTGRLTPFLSALVPGWPIESGRRPASDKLRAQPGRLRSAGPELYPTCITCNRFDPSARRFQPSPAQRERRKGQAFLTLR
jgi:hypothetical protein